MEKEEETEKKKAYIKGRRARRTISGLRKGTMVGRKRFIKICPGTENTIW